MTIGMVSKGQFERFAKECETLRKFNPDYTVGSFYTDAWAKSEEEADEMVRAGTHVRFDSLLQQDKTDPKVVFRRASDIVPSKHDARSLCRVKSGYFVLLQDATESKRTYPREYQIEVGRIKTHEHLIGWIRHLTEKVWFSIEHCEDFVACVCKHRKWPRIRI